MRRDGWKARESLRPRRPERKKTKDLRRGIHRRTLAARGGQISRATFSQRQRARSPARRSDNTPNHLLDVPRKRSRPGCGEKLGGRTARTISPSPSLCLLALGTLLPASTPPPSPTPPRTFLVPHTHRGLPSPSRLDDLVHVLCQWRAGKAIQQLHDTSSFTAVEVEVEVGGGVEVEAGAELLCEINAGLSLKPDVHGRSVRARGCRVRGEGG